MTYGKLQINIDFNLPKFYRTGIYLIHVLPDDSFEIQASRDMKHPLKFYRQPFCNAPLLFLEIFKRGMTILAVSKN